MIAVRIIAWLACIYFGGAFALGARAWWKWATGDYPNALFMPAVRFWHLFAALAAAAVGVFA